MRESEYILLKELAENLLESLERFKPLPPPTPPPNDNENEKKRAPFLLILAVIVLGSSLCATFMAARVTRGLISASALSEVAKVWLTFFLAIESVAFVFVVWKGLGKICQK